MNCIVYFYPLAIPLHHDALLDTRIYLVTHCLGHLFTIFCCIGYIQKVIWSLSQLFAHVRSTAPTGPVCEPSTTCGGGEAQASTIHLSMAANGSSANTTNIITALGNAFKDPSGASMSNDRLAAVLLQNMNQLNDLAKQGKLNQQQIMQVRHDTMENCVY